MIRLLEFGMRNIESKNPLLRTAAQICVFIAEKQGQRIEKAIRQKKREMPLWTAERAEQMKQKILQEISRKKDEK